MGMFFARVNRRCAIFMRQSRRARRAPPKSRAPLNAWRRKRRAVESERNKCIAWVRHLCEGMIMGSEIGVGTGMTDTATMRHAMVASQLRTTGVDDIRVVAAMASVAREDFVPAEARTLAYRDTPIPLGRGRYLNNPMATGRLLTEAAILPQDRVLLIGAATGYTAAVLVELGATVTAVESDAELLATARAAMPGAAGITWIEGPMAEGHAAGAPYDVLLVDGSVEELPAALVAQLRVEGRIAAGIVDKNVTRLTSGRRTEGGVGVMPFVDAECVVLPGFAKPTAFRF